MHLVDARGAKRKFKVTACGPDGVLTSAQRTVYLGDDTRLHLRRNGPDEITSGLHELPQALGAIALNRGDVLLLLLRDAPGHAAGNGEGTAKARRAARATRASPAPCPRRWTCGR